MEQKSPIDPNDLVVFAHIVEAGSLTRAAERLGLPKSTVSRRLAQLEQGLGERLLLRTTRKLTLTDFGRGMLVHARQLASELDAANALAEHRQAGPSGRLRISMPADFANAVLRDVLARYVERYPEVALDIDLSPRRVDLIGENFDLALRFGDLPDDATLAARPIGTFSDGLFASPDYLIRHGHPANPEELDTHASLHLVGRDGLARPWTLSDGTRSVRVAPRVRVTANSPDLLIGLACAGSGITLVPSHYARSQVRAGRLVPVLPQWSAPGGKGWAVFPGRRLMPSRTRAFLDLLAQAAPTSEVDTP
ncbi:MAG: LysR family transcriptional regulator [Azoarcus sp.]|nr:LysR family transcriptional regulator [Azoarcus sp.]